MTNVPPNVRKLAQRIASRKHPDEVIAALNDLAEFRQLMKGLSNRSCRAVEAQLMLLGGDTLED